MHRAPPLPPSAPRIRLKGPQQLPPSPPPWAESKSRGRSEPFGTFVLILLTPLAVFFVLAMCRVRRPCLPSRDPARNGAVAAANARRQLDVRVMPRRPSGAERPGLGLSLRTAGGLSGIAEQQMAAFAAGVEAMPVRKQAAGNGPSGMPPGALAAQ